jgi:outer membrane protein TolC
MTFVVACPVPASADQPAAPPALDEATFLRRVAERSPRRQVFDDRRRAASAVVRVAAVLPNPTLSYEREALPSLDSHEDFLRLGWTLDLAGRRGLATASARAAAEAERANVERDALLLEIEARVAYLEVAHARQQVARLDESRTALLAVVDTLRSRAQQGDASNYDAERAALELDTLDDEHASARRKLEVARLRLGALLGEPATPYDASDPITLPARPADGPLAPRRPDVDAALARVRQAERDLTAARRSWIPRFELVVGMKSSESSGSEGLGYIAGIGGELPVFDRGGASAARSRADARRWQSEARALATEAIAEGEQARRDLVLRIEQAEAYAAGPATRAIDLQRRAVVAYREGDRPILELLDVQRGARHAAVRVLELIYEARRAELELRRALGRNR